MAIDLIDKIVPANNGFQGMIDNNQIVGVSAGFLDEDNMASNSPIAFCSQQSIKAYVDLHANATHTGDVTGSGALTIGNNKVTYAKMQNLATANRVLGSASTGIIGETQIVSAMMAANSVDSDQYVDGSIDHVHLASDIVDGDNIADNSVDTEHIANDAIEEEHIGDGEIKTVAIADAAITLAKQANLAADVIIGRANGAGTGVPTALTATQVRDIINVADGATAGGSPGGSSTQVQYNQGGVFQGTSEFTYIEGSTTLKVKKIQLQQIVGADNNTARWQIDNNPNNSNVGTALRVVSQTGVDVILNGVNGAAEQFFSITNFTTGNKVLTVSNTGVLKVIGNKITDSAGGSIIDSSVSGTTKISGIIKADGNKIQDSAGTDRIDISDNNKTKIDKNLQLLGSSPATIFSPDADKLILSSVDDLEFKIASGGASSKSFKFINNSTEVGSINSSGNLQIDGNLTPNGIVLDGNTITGVDDSGEFTDDDAHIMTSAAVDDRINSYSYLASVPNHSGNLITSGTVAAARVATLNQDTTGTAAVATAVTITANENTNENNVILFAADADIDGGNLGVESDSGLKYNPSTTKITCKGIHSAAGNTISSGAATVLDAGSFVSLDAGNGDVYFKDHSVTKLHLDMDGTNSLIFQLKTNGDSLIFRQFDGKDVLHIDDAGYVGIKNGDTSAGELRIFEDSDDGTNYVGLTVAAMTGSQTYTLPTADGSNGQVLKTNGSGVLAWASVSGGGSNTNIANSDLTLDAGRTLNIDDNSLEIKNGSTLYLGFDDAGINSFLASDDLDIGTFNFRAKSFTSDVATGTAPLVVASTTAVANLQSSTTASIGNLTGDVTSSNRATTIANDAVTYAKIQNVSATNVVLGRDSAGAGVVEEISAANLRTILNVADDANNYVHPNHSGEVTSTADGATVIADNIVDEANLKVSNAPTNGYVLTAQSGNTGGLTWAAQSGGGGSSSNIITQIFTIAYHSTSTSGFYITMSGATTSESSALSTASFHLILPCPFDGTIKRITSHHQNAISSGTSKFELYIDGDDSDLVGDQRGSDLTVTNGYNVSGNANRAFTTDCPSDWTFSKNETLAIRRTDSSGRGGSTVSLVVEFDTST